MRQTQFLTVVSAEEAKALWAAAVGEPRRHAERVPLASALGRVLAEDVAAGNDVPAFDRSNLDGFAVRAADTFGAEDLRPVTLRLSGETLVPGLLPAAIVEPGTAVSVATGAVIPRGADAVVAVEHTEVSGDLVLVRRPVVPGAAISAAGSDVARGETVLRSGEVVTSREAGTLAACGIAQVSVLARPRVAILSTGGELIPPGTPLVPAAVHDSNGAILSAAVAEAGGEALPVEIVEDDRSRLEAALARALASADLVLVSGGTSKGGGDLVPDVVRALDPEGLVVHGVDLKPGKPLGLGRCRGVPIALLPGFPTSAVFTFHEFVAPLLRRMSGRPEDARAVVRARLPRRLPAERGRTEYLLVSLVERDPTAREDGGPRWVAHPMGKGSGSITAFARADGFVRIPGNVEFLAEGEEVEVTLLGREVRPADLVVIGSHCVGLDVVLSRLARDGFRAKTLFVGSMAGLEAAKRGECDVAPMHLEDPATGSWNEPFLSSSVRLVRGYLRRQGLCFRRGDDRFEDRPAAEAVRRALADPTCRIQNRNRGSGTRILVDRLLGGAEPPGFSSESRSHHAVAAAVQQGRADWGVCVEWVALGAGLSVIPLVLEHYDFAVPVSRADRPAVRAFEKALADPDVAAGLSRLGFRRP